MASGESVWVASVALPAAAVLGGSCPSAAPKLRLRVAPLWPALGQERQAAGHCALSVATGEASQERSRARAVSGHRLALDGAADAAT